MTHLMLSMLMVLIIMSSKAQSLKNDTLYITNNKTTTLLFPGKVIHVNRGSSDLLVRPVEEQDNVLFVTAGREKMMETNLSVLTEHGTAYSFIVRYWSNPTEYVKQIGEIRATLQQLAAQIAGYPPTFHYKGGCSQNTCLELNGLYTWDGSLFLQLSLNSKGGNSFCPKKFHFFTKTPRRGKRTASQEIEIKPQYIYYNDSTVNLSSKQSVVVALPAFALPPAGFLSVEVLDQSGTRPLRINIKEKRIEKAKAL